MMSVIIQDLLVAMGTLGRAPFQEEKLQLLPRKQCGTKERMFL